MAADISLPRLRVLVTGAGGPAGVAVIRNLEAAGHVAVGADLDPLAAGLRLASEGAAVPAIDDPAYVDQLCRLAEKTEAGVLVSTLAEEVACLEARAAALAAAGLRWWLPDARAVATCIDKWRFAGALRALGIDGPATALGSAEGVRGPWIVKPRYGRGSRDVYAVDDASELPWVLGRVTHPIVQHRLVGREFTVDALVERDGDLAGMVARWRLETHGGISVKGETFSDAALREGVAALVAGLGLAGAVNVQGFVTDRGAVSFTEVNPRFSGALPLSLAAGADLVGEYLRGVVGLPIRRARLVARDGVRMVRYFEEVFEG